VKNNNISEYSIRLSNFSYPRKKIFGRKSFENFNISENNMILVLKLPKYYDGIYTCKHTFFWLIFARFRPQKIDYKDSPATNSLFSKNHFAKFNLI
jgi:hypothetical protein